MQFIIAILLLSFFCLAKALTDDQIEEQWLNFNLKYGRKGRSKTESHKRYENFKNSLKKIHEHNKLFEKNMVSYEMAINAFADKDLQEMEKYYMGLKIRENDKRKFLQKPQLRFPFSNRLKFPTSKDWRERGAITSVKNQLACGSCWAFASTGALESYYFLKYNLSVALSEQNLVDCVEENDGCEGGWMIPSFQYVHNNGGINSENIYPYQAVNSPCRYQSQHIAATCNGYQTIRQEDEQHMLEIVATTGPLAVAIEVNANFMNYKQGIYNDPSCGKAVNHAVLVVGYGTENRQDYWLVKNSWGIGWGEKGYIRMARNQQNQCAIASFAVYPEV